MCLKISQPCAVVLFIILLHWETLLMLLQILWSMPRMQGLAHPKTRSFLKILFAVNDLDEWDTSPPRTKNRASYCFSLNAGPSSKVSLSRVCNIHLGPWALPLWDLGTRGIEKNMLMLMLLALPRAIKSFISDSGVSHPPFVTMKQSG